MDNEKLRFSTETIEEEGQLVTRYFIAKENKDGISSPISVDEHTYMSLQEDRFYNKNKVLKFHKNDEETNKIESEYCPEHEYMLNFIDNIRNASNDNEAIEILSDEMEFQVTQAYLQGQIDLSLTLSKTMKITTRSLRDELEDCIEDYGFDMDNEED